MLPQSKLYENTIQSSALIEHHRRLLPVLFIYREHWYVGKPFVLVGLLACCVTHVAASRLHVVGQVSAAEARVRRLGASVCTSDQPLPAVPRQVHVRVDDGE